MARDFKFGNWNHKVLGNTWKVNDDGTWFLPEKTLGWQILGWCSSYLKNEDGDPWRFTPEQARFILWWYAIDDRGRFNYRTGVLQRLKGWGKDPVSAALALVEMLGPVRFSHWGSDGQPVGKPQRSPWVTVNAVSQSQTRNTSNVLKWMASDKLIKEFDLVVGVEQATALKGRASILFSASSYRAVEGNRPTFSILNETQHWIDGNHGTQMFETLEGNLTKSPNGTARMLSITNAYMPGEDSVAERQRYAYNEQEELKRLFPDMPRYGGEIYYDSLEADPKAPTDPDTVLEVVKHVRGDSVWLDPESIVGSFMNRSIAVARSRRMFYNQVVAKEDALFEESEWDACRLRDPDKLELKPGTEIVLGFDGGKTDDATALIAKRLSDGCIFPVMVWEAPPKEIDPDWQINREEVDAYVHWCFRTFRVLAFYADVAQWESYIDSWSNTYRDRLLIKASTKSPIGWDMRGGQKRITLENESVMDKVFAETFLHNGNRILRKHALNARRRPNAHGTTFGKESRESPLKVDAYAALLLAEMAFRDLRESGKNVRRTGHVYAY